MWTSSTATGRTLWYLGPLVTAVALSPIAALAWVPTVAAIFLVIGLGGAAALSIHRFAPRGGPLRGLYLTGAVFLTMVAGGLAAFYSWNLQLAYRGEPVVATVTGVSIGDAYALSYDGKRIPGWLPEWPDGDPAFGERDFGRTGDTVIVLRDPLGIVGPGLPIEVNQIGTIEPLVAVGLPLALIVGVCVAAGRERVPPEPVPVVTPQPRRFTRGTPRSRRSRGTKPQPRR